MSHHRWIHRLGIILALLLIVLAFLAMVLRSKNARSLSTHYYHAYRYRNAHNRYLRILLICSGCKTMECLLPRTRTRKGLSNRFCTSVSLSVCQSVSLSVCPLKNLKSWRVIKAGTLLCGLDEVGHLLHEGGQLFYEVHLLTASGGVASGLL